jgi:hypothetical protein
MLLLPNVISTLNRNVIPFCLKHGLSLRHRLSRSRFGNIFHDNPTLDAMLLLPVFQTILAQEIELEAYSKTSIFNKYTGGMLHRVSESDSIPKMTTTRNKHESDNPATTVSTTPHVIVMEQYLRPILVPNEKWSDILRWMFHIRFVRFLRKEYLRARFGRDLQNIFSRYPKLSRGPQVVRKPRAEQLLSLFGLSSSTDSTNTSKFPLPTSQQVVTALRLKSWKRTKNSNAIWNQMTELTTKLKGKVNLISGTNVAFPSFEDDVDTSQLTFEDLLELAGCRIQNTGPFNLLCEEFNIFQLWTSNYIELLASYLADRSNENTVILDVGAGDGLLAHFLYEELLQSRQLKAMPQVIAIDDGSWNIPTKYPVERMTVQKAMKMYSSKHIIVVCSWMPFHVDWTQTFRSYGVQEYILIGESYDGNCGHNWKTWGNIGYLDEENQESSLPPFLIDGYEASILTQLTPHTFSRFDSVDSSNGVTVSFRKMKR